MNIEQKNTLFVVTLVLVVLGSVGLMAYLLVRGQVDAALVTDLGRAHGAFQEADRQSLRTLELRARSLAAEPPVHTAIVAGGARGLAARLKGLAERASVDLVAFYPRGQARAPAGDAVRAYQSSPQVLSSDAFARLAQAAVQTRKPAAGHGLAIDTLLRLVAVPVLGRSGVPAGAMLVGRRLDPRDVQGLHQLIGAQVAVYQGNVVYGSSLRGLGGTLDSLHTGADGLVRFVLAGKAYLGRTYTLDGSGGTTSVLLAVPTASEWGAYQELWRRALQFSSLILLFAALLGIWISRSWLAKPIKSLARATNMIGQGNLDVRVNESRSDELGDLARSFNQMLRQLKLSQSEEELARQRFHDFADSSSDWLWETQADGRFSYLSQNVVATLAVPADTLIDRSFAEVFPQDGLDGLMALLQPGRGEARPLKDVEAWVTTSEGFRLCLRLNGLPYFEGGVFRGFRGTARDITKVKNDEERLVHLANRDHLTGLSNRRRFLEDMARDVSIAQRSGHSGALLLIDLDHFKLVNDTAGHAAGDEVIVQVGSLLRRLSRNADLVARLSGDEFAVALSGTDFDQAQRRAREILKHIGQLHPTYGGKILNTSASIGIVVYPQHGATPMELLAKADTAMYAAKAAGRNRAHLYSADDMAQELMGSQLTWKQRIHEALERDLFELHFQPIASTAGGAVSHFEVLVRLRGGDGRLHAPGSFIPTAEQFGLIQQVDAVVLRKAIHALAEQPPSAPPVSVSINLSGLSVGDAETIKLIEQELHDTGVDRRRVVFEITESAACQNIDRAMGFIARMQQLGCRIALDDFGVGFSSFSYLKHLRADIIKIDGSFIREIDASREDQLFVKALVDVARGMGMQTTAEFVESEQALAMVRSLGVDYAQGYYIGKPAPALPRAATIDSKTELN